MIIYKEKIKVDTRECVQFLRVYYFYDFCESITSLLWKMEKVYKRSFCGRVSQLFSENECSLPLEILKSQRRKRKNFGMFIEETHSGAVIVCQFIFTLFSCSVD